MGVELLHRSPILCGAAESEGILRRRQLYLGRRWQQALDGSQNSRYIGFNYLGHIVPHEAPGSTCGHQYLRPLTPRHACVMRLQSCNAEHDRLLQVNPMSEQDRVEWTRSHPERRKDLRR
jgi:hypothetical protein